MKDITKDSKSWEDPNRMNSKTVKIHIRAGNKTYETHDKKDRGKNIAQKKTDKNCSRGFINDQGMLLMEQCL